MTRQERAVRTREALLRAAAEVFAADGYTLASLPAISGLAGVSTGALHFHFASKDSLAGEVEAVATRSLERLVERRRASVDTPLQLLVGATLDLAGAVGGDIVLRAGFRLGGDPSRKKGEGPGHWWSDWVHALLREAREAGELADGVSPEGAAAAVVATTVGFGMLGSSGRLGLSPQLVEQFWALVLPGLAASPSGSPVRLPTRTEPGPDPD
jgi:AcrR family transcriptional regulator